MTTERRKYSKRDVQLAEDWQAVAMSAHGRRIIADMMVWCNVYTAIEETDPIALARAVGEQNVAKRVAYLLGLKPEEFPAQSWEDTGILDRMLTSGAPRM